MQINIKVNGYHNPKDIVIDFAATVSNEKTAQILNKESKLYISRTHFYVTDKSTYFVSKKYQDKIRKQCEKSAKKLMKLVEKGRKEVR